MQGFVIPALALIIIFVALALPSNYVEFNEGYWPLVVPSELFLILFALSLPHRYRALNYFVAIVLSASLALKLADIGMWRVYSRPFNILLDGPLLLKGVHLLSGILGTTIASLLILVAALILICLLAIIGWGLVYIQKLLSSKAQTWRTAAGIGICVWILLALLNWPLARSPALSYLWSRSHQLYTSWHDLIEFSTQLSQAPSAQEEHPG
ncbi:MAG: hypothetical protein EOO68_13525, partial [Moraxellaceae bacterium]